MTMTITPYVPGAKIPKLEVATGNDSVDRQQAWRAAEEFESFFLARMLDDMFSGLKTDGLFGGGQGETMYRGLLNEQYGKVIADAGGGGIADTVFREILKLQEGNANAHS